MTTERQLFANRQNSLLSTGPKDTSLTRFNGLQHGLRAQSLLIPGEEASEYHSLFDKIRSELNPDNALQEQIVDRIIFYLWRLQRGQRAEVAIVKRYLLLDEYYGEKIDWKQLFESDLYKKISIFESHSTGQISKLLDMLRELKKSKEQEK